MKIRIKGNSIRLRLSQTEVNELKTTGKVINLIEFPQSVALEYRIESVDVKSISASYSGSCVCLSIPLEEAREWYSSDEAGISAELTLDNQASLKILIEKDFVCLTPREGEDESDLFPNPNETC